MEKEVLRNWQQTNLWRLEAPFGEGRKKLGGTKVAP
jgi:hypothetical protein